MIAAFLVALMQISNVPDVTTQVQTLIPPVCADPPAQDTLSGSAGSSTPCTHRADATAQTVIQAKNVTTAADSTWSATFDVPFATVPIYADARIYGQSQPYLCTVTVVTTTGASGRCYQLVATTLPVVATSLLGLVLSPVSNAAGGMSVRVVARQ